MGPPTVRAFAGSGESRPILKNISTFETLCRFHPQLHFLYREGAPDMSEMVIDLFLADAQGCREVPSTMFLAGKQDYNVLPNGLHGSRSISLIFIQDSMLWLRATSVISYRLSVIGYQLWRLSVGFIQDSMLCLIATAENAAQPMVAARMNHCRDAGNVDNAIILKKIFIQFQELGSCEFLEQY